MQSELLRLVTAGSVDDGKSTLIGRLLFDTKQILADQLAHIEETSLRRGDGYVNLALLTDGLRAEREQGITIDVAYRSFVTPQAPLPARRRARSRPVHPQHGHRRLDRRRRGDPARRAQGHHRADAAALLHRRDARDPARRHRGQQDGSRRTSRRSASPRSSASSSRSPRACGCTTSRAIPMSALGRQRRRTRARRWRWYEGPTLLEHLETVEIASDRNLDDRRFPVQWVIRPMSDDHHDYRGYGGAIAGGVWRAGRRGRRPPFRAPRPRRGGRELDGPLGDGDRAAVGDDPARRARSTSAAATCSPTPQRPPIVASELDAPSSAG